MYAEHPSSSQNPHFQRDQVPPNRVWTGLTNEHQASVASVLREIFESLEPKKKLSVLMSFAVNIDRN